MADAAYLSIGEVLGILLEEFPDVTISKIRFLESQGLIEPERTPSGYRKFYDNDVDLLRAIFREQKDNFLPLKVIRDRLESGEIEPDQTGSHTLPRGIKNIDLAAAALNNSTVAARDSVFRRTDQDAEPTQPSTPTVPERVVAAVARVAPAANVVVEAVPVVRGAPMVEVAPVVEAVPAKEVQPIAVPPATQEVVPAAPARAVAGNTGDARAPMSAQELCVVAGLSSDQLASLEQFGVIVARSGGPAGTYGPDAVAVARIAAQLMDQGVDARHLRGWKQSAEREAALFEQLVTPLLRQRNPQSRQRAFESLAEFADLGGQLRGALMQAFVSGYSDSN